MTDDVPVCDKCGHPVDAEDAIESLQYRVSEFQDQYPEVAASLRSASGLTVGSDIGGCHSSSKHLVMTFALIAHDSAFRAWRQECNDMRQRFLPDRRRMSFKGLNDALKRKALPTFLQAADKLHGVLVSIVIEKGIGTLIRRGTLAELSEPARRGLIGWKATALEQAIRLSHLVGVLIARFSSAGQNALWVADDDEAFANRARTEQFIDLFDEILEGCLEHHLGRILVGTPSQLPFGPMCEDLVALADFAAGTVSEWVPKAIESGMLSRSQVSMLPVLFDKRKVNFLMRWYAGDAKPLKRLTIVVQAAPHGRYRVSSIDFVSESRERRVN